MVPIGKWLAIVGFLLLLIGWQLDLIFALTGLQAHYLEEGGTLHYTYHLERDRMIATWIGASFVFLGAILYAGGRVIARNEAAARAEAARQSPGL